MREIILKEYYIFIFGVLFLMNECLLQNTFVECGSVMKYDRGETLPLDFNKLGQTDTHDSELSVILSKGRIRRKREDYNFHKFRRKNGGFKNYQRQGYRNYKYKDTMSDGAAPPFIYSHGVYKVKGQDYYLWAENEVDYANFKDAKQYEVDDPLAGLSEEEKRTRLRYVCDAEKYKQPFRNPKVIQYLRKVYYSLMSRSRNTSISQKVSGYTLADLLRRSLIDRELSPEDITYYHHLHNMHPLVGMMDRTPNVNYDTLFPKYLPLNLPQDFSDFYYRNVALSREGCIEVYRYNNDAKLRRQVKNPTKVRITGDSCYELATYCNNAKANWPDKLDRLFKSNPVNTRYSICSERTDATALEAFYRKTGCIPYLAGMVVNPNAPYLGFNPDAITYCRGEAYLLHIQTPQSTRDSPLHEVLGNLMYINKTNGKYTIRKRHQIYGKLQLGLGILRLEKCLFGIYGESDQKMKLTVVRFDTEFFKNMINNVYRVYFSKLLPRLYFKSFGA